MKNWEKGRKVKIKNQVVRFKYRKMLLEIE